MATRRVLFDPADAADVHPEQRNREVAAILAVGVIRMRMRRDVESSAPRVRMHVAESAENRRKSPLAFPPKLP